MGNILDLHLGFSNLHTFLNEWLEPKVSMQNWFEEICIGSRDIGKKIRYF